MSRSTAVVYVKMAALVCAMAIFSGGCANSPQDEPLEFVLKYGVMYKNELNTHENTFTKDLILDGVTTTDLALSEQQMNDIRKQMEHMDIASYRGANEGRVMLPSSGYQFDIQWEGKQLLVDWRGEFGDDSKDGQMSELTRLIIGMIESNEAFKKLPPIRGGYE